MPIKATIRLRRFAIISVLCALVAGCRNDPYLNSHIEILNAEKRALEDQLYELEYDYERKVAELEEAKAKLSKPSSDDADTRRTNQSPRIEMPGSDDEGLDLSPPMVSPGVPDGASTKSPAPKSNDRSTRTSINSGPAVLEPADPRITHIHIDPVHTGGSDFDQRSGDDGILIVLEPRNRNEAFVPLAGPLSIVVLDYAKREAGNEARIAKWELTAQQVDKSLHNSPSQRGIYLRLPWGEDRPESTKLMVAVRYTTADGRKLDATRDIFVTLPGQLSQRWTPRSSDESDGAESQNRINIARQPSTTDGASIAPIPARSEPASNQVAPASHEADDFPAPASPPTPTWRPYR
ncbi:MAG: hypothetical protein ABI614_13425 [Planctomycetota bacterium]